MFIAPDLFSRWKAIRKMNRGEFRVPISDEDIKAPVNDGLDFLLKHPTVDPNRVAAMGVCQSGSSHSSSTASARNSSPTSWSMGARRSPNTRLSLRSGTSPMNGSSATSPRLLSASGVRTGFLVVSINNVRMLRGILKIIAKGIRIHAVSRHAARLDE